MITLNTYKLRNKIIYVEILKNLKYYSANNSKREKLKK